MKLKKLRRAWLRFIADQNWNADSALYRQAMTVLWWIERLIANIGLAIETWMRRNLSEQLAVMDGLLAQGGQRHSVVI